MTRSHRNQIRTAARATRFVVLSVAIATLTLAVVPLVAVGPAHAQCNQTGSIIICSGSTTSTVSTSNNITLTVLEGAGITITAANSTAVNLGFNGSVVNLGSISGTNDGVYTPFSITSLTNSGTISGGDNGVETISSVTSLTNSGTISGGDNGVDSGPITSLTNSGTISGGGNGVDATTITSLTNSGTISGGDNGVDATTFTSLTNSGTISGGDIGVTAFRIFSLTNSGTIRGADFAIEVTNTNPGSNDTTLTLNAGSILIGHVDLGLGTNTLNIGEGLSLNSTFQELDVIGQTNEFILVTQDLGTSDAQVVTVDPSIFGTMDDALAALTSGIGQTVQGRQSALRSDPALGFSASFANRYAAAQEESLAAFADLDLDDTPHLNPNRFWIEGFGAYREDESDRVGSTFESLTGGLVAGVDVPLDAVTSVGVMAGFAASTSENETDTQETDTMSYYAGVYASTEALGLAWDGALTVGYTDYDQERITANNLVATGLETASADFGGWFINPQVTVTNSTPTGFAPTTMGFALPTIEQSLTLAYAGLFLNGYTETGTTNPLTLDERDVHIASARAALALPFEALHANGALTTIRLIGGIEARAQFGDDAISGTLLGQTVSTTLDDDDTALGGFLGLSGEHQTSSGLTAYANAEAMLETNSAYQISATAGLRIAF